MFGLKGLVIVYVKINVQDFMRRILKIVVVSAYLRGVHQDLNGIRMNVSANANRNFVVKIIRYGTKDNVNVYAYKRSVQNIIYLILRYAIVNVLGIIK